MDADLSQEVDGWLFKKTEGVVQAGPFKGMKLLWEKCWPEDSLSSKLLGCYEEELHRAIELEITRLANKPNPLIVNVGCAEGYYAVGLAKRLPAATVWAVDTSPEAIATALKAAELNGVTLRTGVDLNEVFDKPDLVIMDCEGAEVAYIEPHVWPGLAGATIIVELHSTPEQNTSEILYERCKDLFSFVMVVEGGRNPNAYELLRDKNSLFKWTAVNEHRPVTMCWFVMTPLKIEKLETVGTQKVCGECNLCCKLERVATLDKPPNQWCGHCEIGKGCKIYEQRPNECKEFRCLWLSSNMPDELRPDRVHLYAEGSGKNGYVKVCVDPEHPQAWNGGEGEGAMVIEAIKARGLHSVIQVGHQINFVCGEGQEMPKKLLLDWTL